MAIQILRMKHGVDFVRDDVRVKIDVRQHDLRLEDHLGRTLHLGAVRASFLTSMAFVSRAFSEPYAGRNFTPVPAALTEALARMAKDRGLRDPTLEERIASLYPTPLLYSAPFLQAQFVWQDALRFAACRVAIAHAEDDHLEDDKPDAAVRIVDALGRWRDLFSPTGKAKRALNAALHDFGDTMPPDALWGLRKVALGRPRSKQAHLELLGYLGALAAPAREDAAHQEGLARIIALVERAPDADVDAALTGTLDPRVRDGLPPRDLALLVAQADPDCTSLAALIASAIERAVEDEKDRLPFPKPPIELPAVDGVRFIEDAAQLRDESARMHHCVAHLAADCRRGRAYIFHVERAGTRGTVHLDAGGHVVEYRGPFNAPSIAASWGARELGRWGATLWTAGLDLDRIAWPPGLEAPAQARPLRSVRAIAEAYRAIVARRPEEAQRLAPWFKSAAASAAVGGVGLYLKEGDDDRVYLRTQDGFDVGHSDVADAPKVAEVRAGLRLVYVPRAPGGAFPEPPIPFPQVDGLQLLRREPELLEIVGAPADQIAAAAATASAGERYYLRCALDARAGAMAEVVFVEADRFGQQRIIGRAPTALPRREEALALARRFTDGLWAARFGLDRGCWLGGRPEPRGVEALRTVGECFVVYSRTCDKQRDEQGALARFYATYVERATQGLAWLVVRDRANGLVSVLDRRGHVVARTDALLSREPDADRRRA